jgi:PTS system nitrogen regulatory IIA component
MKIAPFLSADTVLARLESSDRRGVLEELASLVVRSGGISGDVDLVTILENREDLGSTGLGKGVAIPHVRLKNLSELRMAVGRSVEGVDFNAIDGKPVHLFFLLLAPENSAEGHLKTLARISRLLKKPSFRESLQGARDGEEMLRIIVKADEED